MRPPVFLAAALLYLFSPSPTQAHIDWCHFFRSCPSHNGVYECGEWGIKTYCPKPVPNPIYTYKTLVDHEKIPFAYQRVEDPNLDYAEDRIKQLGQLGEKEITYYVTYKDGVEYSRVKTGEKVIKEPVAEIHLVGTKLPEFAREEPPKEDRVATAEEESETNALLLLSFLFLISALFGYVLRWKLAKVDFHLFRKGRNFGRSFSGKGFDF